MNPVLEKSNLSIENSNGNGARKVYKDRAMKGIPAAPGLASGNALVIVPENLLADNVLISIEDINEEIAKLQTALSETIEDFENALAIAKNEANDVSAIIAANISILSDPILIQCIISRIELRYKAETAVIHEFEERKKLYFSAAKSIIFRERALEFDHLKEMLLAKLRDKEIIHSIAAYSVVFARSITPTDMLFFKKAGVLAVITEVGGIASHAAILARSLELPAVIGIKGVTKFVQNGIKVLVDGYSGSIVINPSERSIARFEKKKEQELEHKKLLGELVKMSAETSDGRRIELSANIDVIEDLELAEIAKADSVGLVRSEYQIITKKYIPSEQEQFEWYNEIAERAYPHSVTIRVFDIGSDKYSHGMPKNEANPALGLRGIRFLLNRKDIYEIQIKAILRASKNRNIKIMLPMISSFDEIIKSKDVIENAKLSLRTQGVEFDESIKIGVMIETPAAVMLADDIAPEVDFFSLGTNDLTQYAVAADRTNEYIASIYDPFNPAVLRLIKQTIDSAKRNNIKVSICGELAGHTAATAILIGMGVDDLSVSPSIILEIKKRIRKINYEKAKILAEKVVKARTSKEAFKIISEFGTN